jgi:predicted MFS family arabinose efflux permease
MLLVALAMFGVFFFISLFVQNVLHYSATKAGAAFLPMTGFIVLVAPIAGRISDRVGSRWLMGSGMTLVAGSLALFGRLDEHSSYLTILPAMMVGGLGMSLAMTPTAAAAMGSVPVDKAGVGSAVLNSMRQIGGSLGIALMGAIIASQVHVGRRDPRALGQFVSGLHNALHVAAGIAIVAALVAVVTVRQTRHAAEAKPALEAA